MHHTNYTTYSIDDFVWDESFRNWVLKPDPGSDFFWKDWMNKHSYKEPDIIAAIEIINSFKINNSPITDGEINKVIKNVMVSIDIDRKNFFEFGPIRFRIKHLAFISIAASLILLTGLAFYFNKISINKSPVIYSDLIKTENEELIETINNTNQPMLLKLPDSSTILIEKNARISIARSFNNQSNRKVYLEGEATFEVARNIQRPFFVYANSLVTKVLGTKFKIKSYETRDSTTVEVQSGMVTVYSFVDIQSLVKNQNKKSNGLVLTRNQKANYSSESQTLMATIVDTPVIERDKKISYRFVGASLDEVFNLIKEGYGIEVIYDEKILGTRTLTANLDEVGLYQKLDIICKTINCLYEIIDGKIVIYNHTSSDQ